MNTENEKIKTKIDAEIVNSNTKMYTVSVKVTEAQTNVVEKFQKMEQQQ